jgi:transposase
MGDIDTSNWPVMPQQQKDRMLLAIHCLQGASPAEAAELLGKSRKYAARVLQHLKQHGTFAEVEHHRPPAKFTAEVMAAAKQMLLDTADVALTTGELVELLQEGGMLTRPTDHHNFLVHFEEYLAGQNLTLQVGATDTIFRITEETAAERHSRAQTLLELVPDDKALHDFVFVDEVTFEESPHPKGTYQHMMLHASAGPGANYWAIPHTRQHQVHSTMRMPLPQWLVTACAACTQAQYHCFSIHSCRAEACSPGAAHQGADGPT